MGKIIPWFIRDYIWVFNDKVYERRAEQQLKLLKKWKKKVEESWKEFKSIEPKLFLSIVWNWWLEDNDSLQEKRANLLFNATTIWWVTVWYSEILKELWESEVLILDKIYEEGQIISKKKNIGLEDVIIETVKISKSYKLDLETVKIMVDNFYRLRLAQPPEYKGLKVWWDEELYLSIRTNMYFQLTPLWISFIKACKYGTD